MRVITQWDFKAIFIFFSLLKQWRIKKKQVRHPRCAIYFAKLFIVHLLKIKKQMTKAFLCSTIVAASSSIFSSRNRSSHGTRKKCTHPGSCSSITSTTGVALYLLTCQNKSLKNPNWPRCDTGELLLFSLHDLCGGGGWYKTWTFSSETRAYWRK